MGWEGYDTNRYRHSDHNNSSGGRGFWIVFGVIALIALIGWWFVFGPK